MIKRAQVMFAELRIRLARLSERQRRLAYGLAALAVMLVAAGVWLRLRPGAPADVVRVRRGRITASVEASGKVQASREAWLSLRSGGIVQEVLVRPGAQVGAGDVLVKTDGSEAEAQVRQAELALQVRQIQYDDLKAAPSASQIEIARANLRRAAAVLQAAQSAYDKAGGAANEAAALESAKLDYETAQANFEQATRGPTASQIEVAGKNLEMGRLDLDAARTRLGQATITAPFAGTILQVNVREGETAYGEKVVRLADLSTLEVVAQVDELDIGELVDGQEATIRLDALPGQVFSGRVAHITPGATPARGTVGYEVTISFAPGNASVRPDMTTNLRIITLTHDDTLLVPSRAVEARGRSKWVRVVENGRLRDVQVTTGLADGENSEVLEGLKEGQMVAVR